MRWASGGATRSAFMLTNRPEFHLLDTAAMHLGATPFSIYNTSSPEQIAYLLGDAANRVMVVEAAFLDQAREAIAEVGSVEHLIVLDAPPAGEIAARGELEAVEPRRVSISKPAGARSSRRTC